MMVSTVRVPVYRVPSHPPACSLLRRLIVWVTRVGASAGAGVSKVCAKYKVLQVGSYLWGVILRTGNLPNEHSRLFIR